MKKIHKLVVSKIKPGPVLMSIKDASELMWQLELDILKTLNERLKYILTIVEVF